MVRCWKYAWKMTPANVHLTQPELNLFEKNGPPGQPNMALWSEIKMKRSLGFRLVRVRVLSPLFLNFWPFWHESRYFNERIFATLVPNECIIHCIHIHIHIYMSYFIFFHFDIFFYGCFCIWAFFCFGFYLLISYTHNHKYETIILYGLLWCLKWFQMGWKTSFHTI